MNDATLSVSRDSYEMTATSFIIARSVLGEVA
jgi:hypothetical protein